MEESLKKRGRSTIEKEWTSNIEKSVEGIWLYTVVVIADKEVSK